MSSSVEPMAPRRSVSWVVISSRRPASSRCSSTAKGLTEPIWASVRRTRRISASSSSSASASISSSGGLGLRLGESLEGELALTCQRAERIVAPGCLDRRRLGRALELRQPSGCAPACLLEARSAVRRSARSRSAAAWVRDALLRRPRVPRRARRRAWFAPSRPPSSMRHALRSRPPAGRGALRRPHARGVAPRRVSRPPRPPGASAVQRSRAASRVAARASRRDRASRAPVSSVSSSAAGVPARVTDCGEAGAEEAIASRSAASRSIRSDSRRARSDASAATSRARRIARLDSSAWSRAARCASRAVRSASVASWATDWAARTSPSRRADRLAELASPNVRERGRAAGRIPATAKDDDTARIGQIAVGRHCRPSGRQLPPAGQQRLEIGCHDGTRQGTRRIGRADPVGQRSLGHRRRRARRPDPPASVRAGAIGEQDGGAARAAELRRWIGVAPQQRALELAPDDRLDRRPRRRRRLEPIEERWPTRPGQPVTKPHGGIGRLGDGVELGTGGAEPLVELRRRLARRVRGPLRLVSARGGRLERAARGRRGLGHALRGGDRLDRARLRLRRPPGGTLVLGDGLLEAHAVSSGLFAGAGARGDPIGLSAPGSSRPPPPPA